MCSAIEACSRVDEAKEIRDRARAMEVYARQALNRDSERKAIEIRIRAERRAGELLKAAKDAGQRHNGRGNNRPKLDSRSSIPTPTLTEIGISADQSSDWQKLAEIPEAEFESALKPACSMPSTIGVLVKCGKGPPPPLTHCDLGAIHVYYSIVDHVEKDMKRPAAELFNAMQDFQQEHLLEIMPRFIAWLKEMK